MCVPAFGKVEGHAIARHATKQLQLLIDGNAGGLEHPHAVVVQLMFLRCPRRPSGVFSANVEVKHLAAQAVLDQVGAARHNNRVCVKHVALGLTTGYTSPAFIASAFIGTPSRPPKPLTWPYTWLFDLIAGNRLPGFPTVLSCIAKSRAEHRMPLEGARLAR